MKKNKLNLLKKQVAYALIIECCLMVTSVTVFPQVVFAQITGTSIIPEARGICPNPNSAATAIGCVPYQLSDFIDFLIKFGLGIGGGVALLMMIIGGYEILTNPAGPEEIQEGKKLITNAVIGLLLMLFSISILHIIGGGVLGISNLPY